MRVGYEILTGFMGMVVRFLVTLGLRGLVGGL